MHLVASLGGHLELLLRLDSCFDGFDRVWVTAAGDDAVAPLLARGDRVVPVPRFSRSRTWTAIANVARSLTCALRERPDVVVTSGAGSVVAFSAFARALGAKTTFVETTARVTTASASGHVLARLASRVLVQWPEMAEVYPRAVVCRPALWEGIPAVNHRKRSGTVVAVGTHRHSFDRLLEVADRAAGEGLLPGPIVAQSGVSGYRPEHFEARPYLSREELNDAIDGAEYVVCHGGSGVVFAALRAGHKPLVLPRLTRHREHVDDHQRQSVDKLASMGLIVPLDGPIGEHDLVQADQRVESPVDTPGPSVQEALLGEIARAPANGNSAPSHPGRTSSATTAR